MQAGSLNSPQECYASLGLGIGNSFAQHRNSHLDCINYKLKYNGLVNIPFFYPRGKKDIYIYIYYHQTFVSFLLETSEDISKPNMPIEWSPRKDKKFLCKSFQFDHAVEFSFSFFLFLI